MNNQDFSKEKIENYEELVQQAEEMIESQKYQWFDEGEEENYYCTYRISVKNGEPRIYTYVLALDCYKDGSTEELKLQLEEAREELEELKSEIEDIEDGWNKDQFDTEEEYFKRVCELEDDIFSLEIEISLYERFIKEKDDELNKTPPYQMWKFVNHLTCEKLKKAIETLKLGFISSGGREEAFYPVCQFTSDGDPLYLIVNNLDYFNDKSEEELRVYLEESKTELRDHIDDKPYKENFDSAEEYEDAHLNWSLERFAIENKIALCESLMAEKF